MINDVSGETFRAVKRLFPDLPEHITQFTLTIKPDEYPVIECRFFVKVLGALVEESETFQITEMNYGGESRMTRPAETEIAE